MEVDQRQSHKVRTSCNEPLAVTQAKRHSHLCRCREDLPPQPYRQIRVRASSEQLFHVLQCQARPSECSSKRDRGPSRPTLPRGFSKNLFRALARICPLPCQVIMVSHSLLSSRNRSVKPSSLLDLKTRDSLETSSSRSCITRTLVQGLIQKMHPL